MFAQSLSAQTPAAARYDAELERSRSRILKTAEALGISVYEDFPVQVGSPAYTPVPTALPVFRAEKGRFQVPVLSEPEPQPAEPRMNKGRKLGYLVLAYHAIAAQISDSGLLFWREKVPCFEKISASIDAAVGRTAYGSRRAGESSLLEDEGFVKELEALTGARFLDGGSASALMDGPVSFEVKDRLMREAKKSIYIASYAFYDDVTGNETAGILLEKKRAGVDVKVLVDAKMTAIFGAGVLKRLEAGGVEVLRYREARAHDYLHVKLLIVDEESAVVGGMNYGDEYSHKGNSGKWRDTDVLYTGPAVTESVRVFAEMWNPRAKAPARRVAAPVQAAPTGAARIAVLPQDPPTLEPPILTGIVKAIYGATRRVNIENAYLIAVPALDKAVADACVRGVEVNILTNSKESIDADGKAMADTILDGLRVFAAAGANIYVQRGETLHSKFMTVDGVYVNVGSYNMHPRSERYDTELNVAIIDAGTAAEFDGAFDRDIAGARRMTREELDTRKSGWFSRLLGRFGYSQLNPK